MDTSTLENLVKRHEIRRWEIHHVPLRILSPVAFTPESLERSSSYTLIIRRIWPGNTRLRGFLDALKATKAIPTREPSDLRWGCSFYDRKGVKVFSVYLAALGSEGVLNGRTVRFEGELPRWFRSFSERHFTD